MLEAIKSQINSLKFKFSSEDVITYLQASKLIVDKNVSLKDLPTYSWDNLMISINNYSDNGKNINVNTELKRIKAISETSESVFSFIEFTNSIIPDEFQICPICGRPISSPNCIRLY